MKKIKAFTLIETLIVIVVFCIGILAVLQWLSQTLRNKDYANTQIKAAFFAREWIELVFNLRDANYHKELPWNCIFNYVSNPITVELDENDEETEDLFCNWKLWIENGKYIKIWMWSGKEYINVEPVESLGESFDDRFENSKIYFHTWYIGNETWFWYDYDSTNGKETWFARYLVIDTVNWVDDSDKLLKIQSYVLYKKGYLTWEKIMETFIGNYEFKE